MQQLYLKCPDNLRFRLQHGSATGIGDGGVIRLSKLLSRHDNLRFVDLGSQRITDDGCVALMRSLQVK